MRRVSDCIRCTYVRLRRRRPGYTGDGNYVASPRKSETLRRAPVQQPDSNQTLPLSHPFNLAGKNVCVCASCTRGV